jgi:hypothetical protein
MRSFVWKVAQVGHRACAAQVLAMTRRAVLFVYLLPAFDHGLILCRGTGGRRDEDSDKKQSSHRLRPLF